MTSYLLNVNIYYHYYYLNATRKITKFVIFDSNIKSNSINTIPFNMNARLKRKIYTLRKVRLRYVRNFANKYIKKEVK